jgi:ubiquinone/menaquinone biosynthesis C-methylase UbiE
MNTDYLKNWTKLLENKDASQFLKDPSLFGIAQGTNNKGRQQFADYIYHYIQPLDSPIKILEVGFGTNISYQLLKDRKILPSSLVTYYGADVTPKFIELAEKQYPEIILTELFEDRISYPDQHFDITYIRHVLEHQNGYKLFLTELLRVTRYHAFINMFIPLNKDSNEDILAFDGKFFHNTYAYSKFINFCRTHQFTPVYDKTFLSEELAEVRKNEFEPFKDEIIVLQRIN